MHSILLIFLDGFGLGKANSNNPLYLPGLPCLERKTGCKFIAGSNLQNDSALLKGIDACLGVDGVPQSATGQTSLLTGINASAHLGYHLPAFPNPQLIELIQSHSVLKQVTDMGLQATFANAYTDTYFEKAARRKFSHSVTTHCVLSANLPFRNTNDLRDGNAVYWDITREHLIPLINIEPVTPSEAGKHLAALGCTHALTLYECFATDLIGHSCSSDDAIQILAKIDTLLCSCIDSMHKNVTLLLCSDHGNIEDLSTGSHTVNKVPLFAFGPEASSFQHITRIDEVTPAIIEVLKKSSALEQDYALES